MTNEEKAKEIGRKWYNDGANEVAYRSALQAAMWKDEELKNHEQSLLWTFESILDKIVVDKESYNTALKEFKSHLINKL